MGEGHLLQDDAQYLRPGIGRVVSIDPVMGMIVTLSTPRVAL